MRKYEVTMLDGSVVVVEAECPSIAIKKAQQEAGCLYFYDIQCVK